METFGKYTLVEPLGRGGMGEVWHATLRGPAGFEKHVALKRMRPELTQVNQGNIEMFISEAKLVAQLSHPNIVPVFDFGIEGNDYYLAMEFVRGAPLSAVMRRGRLSVEAAIAILADAARALAYAHGATDAAGRPLEVVHRDVTPHNLLVAETGDVKLSDFGIARTAGAIGYTTPGAVRGKVPYMSPEQTRGETLDGRTDVFALGLIAWELLATEPLFSERARVNDLFLLKEIGTFKLDEARLTCIPESARPIVARALASDRASRPDARTLEMSLGALLDGAALARGRGELAMRAHEAALPVPGETASLVLPRHGTSGDFPSTSSNAPTVLKPLQQRGCRARVLGPAGGVMALVAAATLIGSRLLG